MDQKIFRGEQKMTSLKKLFTIAILCTLSCTQTERKITKKDVVLPLVAQSLKKGISFNEVKNLLGDPHETVNFEDFSGTVYYYHSKVTQFRDWSFSVGQKGNVIGILYRPLSNPFLDRVEVLPMTWKEYDCKKKRKPDTRVSHVTKDYTFLECAGGRIKAYYNMHGEITDIAIEPKKHTK